MRFIVFDPEMLRLAASLMTVTAVVEIALRNAVCDRLTDHFGVAPAGIPHVQLSKVRQAAIPVPMGQVVAQLTMYFWKRLFSGDYDHALWKPALKRVFPDKSVSRAAVASHLESIYQTRNRITHHEPVYGRRLAQTETAIEFVARHLGGRGQDGATPLEKLLQPEMVELQNRAGEMRRRLDTLLAGAG